MWTHVCTFSKMDRHARLSLVAMISVSILEMEFSFLGTAAGTTVRNMYQWDGNTVTIYTVSDSPFEQELSADDSFSVQAKEIGISKEEYVQLLSEGTGVGIGKC